MTAKYGVPKNTLSTWVKNKHKLTTSLEQKGMSSSRESTGCGSYDEIHKHFSTCLLEKEAKKLQLMGSYLKRKYWNLRKHRGLRNLKHQIVGSITGIKGINITTAFYLPSFVLHWTFLQRISTIFLGLEIFNLQGTCIPSPSPRLTSLPVMTTLHSASRSALKK